MGACITVNGFGKLTHDVVAPPLMWSEVISRLHEKAWRGEISTELARLGVDHLASCPVEPRAPRNLRSEAWRIADELGWAKTYDAEYVALAQILGCKVLTADGRFKRGAERLGIVITADEL